MVNKQLITYSSLLVVSENVLGVGIKSHDLFHDGTFLINEQKYINKSSAHRRVICFYENNHTNRLYYESHTQ